MLPAPNLDDRRFQDLVDDAKRMVQQRCPQWTDHNVSDPGVTLIETFAFMVDQLLYRLNRVPDRNYVKFLEMLGVGLYPPVAARADVTFWLSAAQPDVMTIPVGLEVSSTNTGMEDPTVFTVVEERQIPPVEQIAVLSSVEEPRYRDHGEDLAGHKPFQCFDTEPKPGDALYVGLSKAAPGCAVSIDFDCQIEGVGVDPRYPPLVWEAWDGDRWAHCDVELDDTGGLNRAGQVIIHVPRGHSISVIARHRAGWVRCRVIEPWEGQPFYSASPLVNRVEAETVGGTTEAVHAELCEEEILGLSEGVPGQRFFLRRAPVVGSDEDYVVEVAAGEGWQAWTLVDSFADSGPEDRHFMLDATTGEVVLGPAVRMPDGTLRQYGAVPPKGAPLRMPPYRTGGGRHGNVSANTLVNLRTTLPFVSSVTNRRAATGGVDGEDMENAKVRGPIVMRTRGRAVTPEDYEQLARAAAPEVARIRCAPAGSEGTEPGGIRVLVVPTAEDESGLLRFEQLLPADDTLERIARYLDERRMIGARVIVEPPTYQGITVVARLRAKPRVSASRLQARALEALYRYFHPVNGGPGGDGWPFGRPVHVGEVYSTLQRLEGVEFVEEAQLFPADPVTGDRGAPEQRVQLSEHALAFSFEHSVLVEEA